MTALVRTEREGAIVRIVIDHPPVNALSRGVIEELTHSLAEFRGDTAIRVVIVQGAGGRVFVAGADITEFPTIATAAEADAAVGPSRILLAEIERFPVPVIAQISGFCLGGGLELAMACDLRVAAADARFGQPEVKLGLIPGGGGTQRLPRLIGRPRALLLNVLGEPISAQQAYEWGLVEVVVDPSELQAEVLRLANRIAASSSEAVRALKRLHVETAELTLAEGLVREAATFSECLIGAEGREGVAAFLEKRAPRWADGR